MIIATAIGTLLNGNTVNVINEGTPVANHPISYHYGDQNELLLWLKVHRKDTAKYPLIWYILKDYTEFNGTYKVNDAKLIIMAHTKPNPLNTWRQSNSYTGIINPTWEVVKTSLLSNSYVNIQSQTLADKFKIVDKPNYGIDSGKRSDLAQGADFQAGTMNIATDIVDARVVRFNLEIEAECIINNN